MKSILNNNIGDIWLISKNSVSWINSKLQHETFDNIKPFYYKFVQYKPANYDYNETYIQQFNRNNLKFENINIIKYPKPKLEIFKGGSILNNYYLFIIFILVIIIIIIIILKIKFSKQFFIKNKI